MPSNVVKTERDEKLWSKAKYAAGKRGSNKNYALVNHCLLYTSPSPRDRG